MAKFLTGKALNNALAHIVWDAKKDLIILSPFIRFDSYFKQLFDRHINSPELHILIVFGKNETAVEKSLSHIDVQYLQKFPNISVIYEANLHAKFYGNENKSLITSLNLHDYSFDKNIEFGLLHEGTIMDDLSEKTASNSAWNKAYEVASTGIPILIRRPMFQKRLLSLIKNYVRTETLLDETRNFSMSGTNIHDKGLRLEDFSLELDFAPPNGPMPEKKPSVNLPVKTQKKITTAGYCIRTGQEIQYNPERPFSYDAFKEWEKYKNMDYTESYCHKTGTKSFGKTSFRHPILNSSYQNKNFSERKLLI